MEYFTVLQLLGDKLRDKKITRKLYNWYRGELNKLTPTFLDKNQHKVKILYEKIKGIGI